jgi:pimeloyl-ACP methyl ester carboxylesterase
MMNSFSRNPVKHFSRTSLLVLAPLLVAGSAAAQAGGVVPAGALDSAPFEEAPCPFAAPPDVLEQFRCGYLHVLENRAVPDGRRLRLAVAVLSSRSSDPRPDPVVNLSGGPGVPALDWAVRQVRSRAWDDVLEEREVILFDQRGTGHSEPQFCPEVTDEYFRLTFTGMRAEERRLRQREVLTSCGATMNAAGVDLSQYNSVASAADMQDLRRALGYGEWNVYGGSYGSRLALEALRSAPAGIRSVILDGPAPPHVALHTERGNNLADVLSRLSAQCAAQQSCNARFPDIENRFWQVVEELDERPLLVSGGAGAGLPDPMVLDGRLLAEGLYQALYVPQFLPLAPLFIHEAGRRNSTMVLELATPLSGGIRNMSRAMNLAVECFESAPFDGAEARPGTGDRHRQILDRIGWLTGSGADMSVCDAWHPFRAGPEQGEQVRSDVPALIFTGEFDPATPRHYGPLAAAGLSNVFVAEIRAEGHVGSRRHECTRTLMLEFLNAPGAALDGSCLETAIRPLHFITDVRVVPGAGRMARGLASRSRIDLGAIGLPLLVMLSATAGWPMAAGIARVRRREKRKATSFERRAYWAAAAVALLALAYVIGLVMAITTTAAENPIILVFGVRGWAAPLLLLPWLLLAGSVALAAFAVIAWRRGAWTAWGRVHFSLVAAASIALALLPFLFRLV